MRTSTLRSVLNMATPKATSTQTNRVMIVVESPEEVQVDYQGLLCHLNQVLRVATAMYIHMEYNSET